MVFGSGFEFSDLSSIIDRMGVDFMMLKLLEQITKDSGDYGGWLIQALSFPPAADLLYQKNAEGISRIAGRCRALYGVPTGILHRGIIVRSEYVKENHLIPDPKVPTISFSEDKEIAREFADINSEISLIIKLHGGADNGGYLIEHEPVPEEILFYWKWITPLGLDRILRPDVTETIIRQKEVILIQTGKHFKLEKY